ncbi:TorF family putative porin [soil metagenome]
MRLIKTFAAAAALALLATAGAASAQTVSYNVALTSDYVYRGFSQNNEGATLSAGADLTWDSGFYAGVWASDVDFGDGTAAELDTYGGYRTELAGFGVDVGVIGYGYFDEPSGADWSYFEVKGAVSRAFGPVTAGAAVYYTPDFTGPVGGDQATYVEANAAFTPITNLTISGAIGEQYLDENTGDDYATWNVGASYALPNSPLTVDVRYYDTDLDNVQLAKERVVGTLKAVF